MQIKEQNKHLITNKITVNINDIAPNPYNPNKMDDFSYNKMKKVLKEVGLFGSIIVRENAGMYQILDGEHRWKACKELGYKEIPVENAGEMKEIDVKFWTMYFNNTRGKGDILKEAKLLEEISIGQKSLLPWTEDEIKNREKLVEWSVDQFNEEREEPKEDNKKLIQVIVQDKTLKAWEYCIDLAKQNGKTEEEMLVYMIDDYIAISKGRSPDDENMKL